jgi:hypothetical protein
MTWVNGILGVLLVAASIFGSVILQRKIKGDETPLFGSTRGRRRDGDDANEIEAFIAAYRSGQAVPADLLNGASDIAHAVPAGTTPAGSDASAAAVAVAGAAHAGTPGVFLRPEVKLAYLTFRSGLRDHHIFANVLLRDLGYGTAVVGKVDLLVCDNSFNYVAFVDVFSGEPAEDIPKSVFLGRLGIKHLKLSTSAMPKPAQLRELIYGKQSG